MDQEERVVRLAKPLKKGLLRLVFSRFCVIALLLVFQIAVLVLAYGYFTDKLPILIYLLRLLSLVMVVYLFNCNMDSSAKLTWMFIIAIFPLPGAAFLFFTQSNIGHRMETKLVDQQIQESRNYLSQPENVLEKLEHDGCGVDDLLPLVRNDAKLVACGLLDDNLTPTSNALEFLEGRVAIPGIKARGLGAENSHGSDDDLFDGLDLFAG